VLHADNPAAGKKLKAATSEMLAVLNGIVWAQGRGWKGGTVGYGMLHADSDLAIKFCFDPGLKAVRFLRRCLFFQDLLCAFLAYLLQ
jgi:hypothetical protein